MNHYFLWIWAYKINNLKFMMKDSTSKSSFCDLQEFIEEGSLTINDSPTDNLQLQ